MATLVASPPAMSSYRATFTFFDSEPMHKTPSSGSQTPSFSPHRDYNVEAELDSFSLDASTTVKAPLSEAQVQLAKLKILSDEPFADDDLDSNGSHSASAIFEHLSTCSSPASSPAPSAQSSFMMTAKGGALSPPRPVPLQRTLSASMVRSYSNPVSTQAEVDAFRRQQAQVRESGTSSPSTLAAVAVTPARAKSSDDLTPRTSNEQLRRESEQQKLSDFSAAYPYSMMATSSPTSTIRAGKTSARPSLSRAFTFEPSTLHRAESWH